MKVKLKDYGTGDFIRIIREWTGLTQEEFAKRISKTRRTIQDYESGKINYGIKTLQRIEKEFNIHIIAEKEK